MSNKSEINFIAKYKFSSTVKLANSYWRLVPRHKRQLKIYLRQKNIFFVVLSGSYVFIVTIIDNRRCKAKNISLRSHIAGDEAQKRDGKK